MSVTGRVRGREREGELPQFSKLAARPARRGSKTVPMPAERKNAENREKRDSVVPAGSGHSVSNPDAFPREDKTSGGPVQERAGFERELKRNFPTAL